MQLESIRAAAGRRGLSLRGGFHPVAGDSVPLLAAGGRPQTILLLGNVDREMWPVFRASPEAQGVYEGEPDLGSLDRWSLRVITELARDLGAEPAFPFGGPPHYPFQRWAQKSEPVWPSPLGMLIHSEYGLWHAYRGALCFGDRIPIAPLESASSPCESCSDRPCLTSCPVAAFQGESYDVPVCAAHLMTPEGTDCMELGCRARRACPVGESSRYEPEQAGFHMTAFLDARSDSGEEESR